MMCVFLVGEGCFVPTWPACWARPAPGFRRINARGNETGDISMRQGAPCLYRGCWCWFWVCVFGILYFGGVSKYRNKYRTGSIRASWWDYGRKGGSEIAYASGFGRAKAAVQNIPRKTIPKHLNPNRVAVA